MPETPAAVKLTEPSGEIAPAPEESVTVAVHCDAWPTTTGVTQDTVVVVVLCTTVSENVPELEEWVESGEYDAVIECGPSVPEAGV